MFRFATRALDLAVGAFDGIESGYRSRAVQNFVWISIVLLFVSTGFAIELGNLGILPVWTDLSPLYSIHLAFTAILITEIFELVGSFSRSFTEAVRRQVEIFSLILLRQAFEVLADIADDESFSLGIEAVLGGELGFLAWVSDGFGLMTLEIVGALTIFALTAVFRRTVEHPALPITSDEQNLFVRFKKVVALVLFGVLGGFVVLEGYGYVVEGDPFLILSNAYLAFIYADILLIVVSYRFDARYDRVFRNSAFAASALLLRLGFAAEPFERVTLGVLAALTLCATGFAFAAHSRVRESAESRESEKAIIRVDD